MLRSSLAAVSLSVLLLAACQSGPADAPDPSGETAPAPDTVAVTEPAAAPLPPEVPPAPVFPAKAPANAVEALNAYYETLDAASFPVAPAGAALPDASTPLSRILVGSCNNEEDESPALATIASEDADLFLMIGDNVYGDSDAERGRISNEPDLGELRESLADLAARPEFVSVRARHPMMVAWDDHDYGANDAGGDFPFRRLAERLHETFWGLADEDLGAWPGTYHARTFGPEGQRTQVIMLDTRSFRSPLRPTDEWNAPGKERYIPQTDAEKQDMLGAAQWTWLENQLSELADLRLIISSIQIATTDGHGYEHWNTLPAERARLFELIGETGAEGVVFVSGDRHSGFLYRIEDEALPYPVHELTASSLNMSFRDETDERDSAQLGAGVAKRNFGAIGIDWAAGTVTLSLHGETGEPLRDVQFAIPGRNG